jgi:hypothetical protein
LIVPGFIRILDDDVWILLLKGFLERRHRDSLTKSYDGNVHGLTS